MRLNKLLTDFCDIKYIPSNIDVLDLTIDSRVLNPGTLFIALPGINNDGRAFIKSALDCGNNVVAEYPVDIDLIKQYCKEKSLNLSLQDNLVKCGDCVIVVIKDLSEQISKIANRFYFVNKLFPDLIGVTGTNGKTTVTHFIASILSENKLPTATVGTIGYGFINNLVDNKLTTADCVTNNKTISNLADNGAKAVCMEVSSHAVVQNRVKDLPFKTLVFTNLSQDHLDYHKTMDNYYNAKAKLFLDYQYKNAVINIGCEYGRKLYLTLIDRSKTKYINDKINIITYATNADSNVDIVGKDNFVKKSKELEKVKTKSATNKILNVSETNIVPDIKIIDRKITTSGIQAKIITPWGDAQFTANLLGEFNLDNILASIAVAGLEEVKLENIISAVANLKPVPGRMNFIQRSNKPLVVVDYAHTPDAIYKSLESLNHIKPLNSKLICVFGCGGDRDASKRPKMLEAAQKFANHVIITNDNPRTECSDKIIKDILSQNKDQQNISIKKDRRQAINFAINLSKSNDIILIAGKGHEEYQIEGRKTIPFSDFQETESMLK